MAQLTRAMRSPSRTRKIQSSPTLDTRNLWQCTVQTGSRRGKKGTLAPKHYGERRLLFIALYGLLIAVTSLVVEHRL